MEVDSRDNALLQRPNSNYLTRSTSRRTGTTMTRQTDSSNSSDNDATPAIILTTSEEEEEDAESHRIISRRPVLNLPTQQRPRSARPPHDTMTSTPSQHTYSSHSNRVSLRVYDPRSNNQTDGLYQIAGSRYTSSSTRYMSRSGMESMDAFVPRQNQYQNKVVCEIRCRHCRVVCCRRGMRAILLADTNVRKFTKIYHY
jgi:hypothetical protein